VRTLLEILTAGTLTGLATGRRIQVMAVRLGPKHFEPLADQCLAGQVDIHIDRTFPLDEVPQALAFHGEGHALGKVVIDIAGRAREA
jgi:NADPH:quinone reductase-like Zn-dependent oxidoreductase